MIDKQDLDICQNRHRDNAESIAVNPAIAVKFTDRSIVYDIIQASKGVTSKEIARQMGRRLNCISGRISELKRAGLIRVVGRRNDCGILYAK